MPPFPTPEPISVTLELDIGSARISAGERTTTTVEVLPSDGADDTDVRAAQQTRVDCANGALVVKGPRNRSLFGRTGSIDVSIELPAGSDLRATAHVGDLVCAGRLGECRLRTSIGDIRVEEAVTVQARTNRGDIRVERVAEGAEIIGAGPVHLGRIGGAATVKSGNGGITVRESVGELRMNAAHGRISVDVAHAGVNARSADGGIRLGEVARGRMELHSAVGDVEIGVRASTAAWLDVHTQLGKVRNALGPAEGPEPSEETVEVRATTGIGDIVVRRA